MYHQPVKYHPDAFWGVSRNSKDEVLLQVADEFGEQVRIRLGLAEAARVAGALNHTIWSILEEGTQEVR